VKYVILVLLSACALAAGTISLSSGTISVSGGDADSSAAPAFVANPNAFNFKITDGITSLSGQQRRNTDPAGGANKDLNAVGAFDGRQLTITGAITALRVADSEGDRGGHSQAFAIGVSTRGWRDQAAATYNLNLIGFQPSPAKDGFAGIAFGYRQGSLFLAAYDYDNQPDQLVFDLSKAGLASGQSLTTPITFSLVFSGDSFSVKLNNQALGSVKTSHDLNSVLLVAMGASVDPANETGSMTYSSLTATTPSTPGSPAVLYAVSGDSQTTVAGTAAPKQLVVGVVDALRNPLPGVTISFAGTNATANPASAQTDKNGRASTTVAAGLPGDAIISAATTGLPAVTFNLKSIAGSALPTITGVVNGAGFLPGVVSGSWATITGLNLALTTRTSGTDDFSAGSLSTKLDSTAVTINGRPAFVYFVSPAQLNVIVPDDATIGGISVQVTTQAGISNVFTAAKATFAPALFMYTPVYPAAVHADGSYLGPPGIILDATTRPAKPKEIILLFATGLGDTIPLVAAGTISTNAAPLAVPVTATVGGLPADVKGYLIYPGVYQLNLTVPDLPDGDAALQLSIAGSRSADGLLLRISR
jgi:uncharacterized protein (TIGR03437 family)